MSDRTVTDQRTLPGFRSRHLKNERKMWIKMFVIFNVLLIAIVLGILSLYWGGDHSLQFNMPAATVAIIDLDGQEVGPAMVSYVQQFRASMGQMSLGYVYPSASQYPSNEVAMSALKNEDYWFGVVIQSNATSLMNYAYENGNATYDPTGAIHVYYEESRNALALTEFMFSQVSAVLMQFVSEYAKQKQASLLTANAANTTALAYQAQLPIPISYALYNTAPYVPSTAEAATEIGTIYLIIISFLSVLIFDKLHEGILGKISNRAYMAWRILVLPCVYFYLSALYLVLSIMWQIDFGKFFGASGYVLYWILSWLSMMAFGLTVENFNNAIGMPFTPVFFVFWVISNVVTGFYPVELLSNFYRWGLAWPLRHNLIASKTIIFGTKNVLGLNFGVTIAWVGLGLILLPLTVRLQMHKKKAVLEKQRQEVLDRKYGEEEKDEER